MNAIITDTHTHTHAHTHTHTYVHTRAHTHARVMLLLVAALRREASVLTVRAFDVSTVIACNLSNLVIAAILTRDHYVDILGTCHVIKTHIFVYM